MLEDTFKGRAIASHATSSGRGGMPLMEPAEVHRFRQPEGTVVYRLFEEPFERYVREQE